MADRVKEKNSKFAAHLIEKQQHHLARVDYVAASKIRFGFTVDLCRKLVPSVTANVLDIGRSYQSYLLAEYYENVITLGFPLDDHGYGHEWSGVAFERMPIDHIVCDLNEAQHIDCIDTDQRFDLIVFSEVLEHLFTAPELVLFLLKSVLAKGGLIVCLIPNAAALPNRLKLLRGINPYERIRFDRNNPGHFRECTKDEMVDIGRTAGLQVVKHIYSNFTHPARSVFSKAAIYKAMCAMYSPFMPHQAIVFKSTNE